MSVLFSYADRKLSMQNKIAIKAFVETLVESEKRALEMIRYIFCSDEFLLDINKRFLNHDTYTDIVTFDFRDSIEDPINSEIYVSVDRVKDNAAQLKVPFEQEMLRVIFHGPLHLCGWKDKTKSEKQAMRDQEDYYLRLYNKQNL